MKLKQRLAAGVLLIFVVALAVALGTAFVLLAESWWGLLIPVGFLSVVYLLGWAIDELGVKDD